MRPLLALLLLVGGDAFPETTPRPQRINSRFTNFNNDISQTRFLDENDTTPTKRLNHRNLKLDADPLRGVPDNSSFWKQVVNSSGNLQQRASLSVEEIVEQIRQLSQPRSKRSNEDETDGGGLTTKNLNDIVDFIVEVMRDYIKEHGMDQVPLPDVRESFSRKILVATVRGSFKGDGGWVRRLATVRRTGDVRAARHGPGVMSVSCALGLQQLSAGFERYEARLERLGGLSGKLVADVGFNSIRLNVSFAARQEVKGCDIRLRQLQVERLDDIKVRATGLSPFNWLLSQVATWTARRMQDRIKAAIEKELAKALDGHIPAIPCDSNFINSLSFV